MNRFELKMCDIQGGLFELASENNFSSVQFIQGFMRSEVAKNLDSSYYPMQKMGEEYLLSALNDEFDSTLSKTGEVYPKDVMYWIGYIYRYWHYLYDESSDIIYTFAPAETMRANYLMFHTMDPEMAIENLIEIKEAEDEIKQAEADRLDADRIELGFSSLSHYGDYLEQDLAESKFSHLLVVLFEKINGISNAYEDIYAEYDELIEVLTDDIQEEQLTLLEQSLAGIIISSEETQETSSKNQRIERIKEWAYEKINALSECIDKKLPDTICFGESYIIEAGEDNVYELVLDEYQGIPEPGETVFIYVNLYDSSKQIIATGYIEMTVGYLEIDDEGNVGDGVLDSIDYYCEDILNAVADIYKRLKEDLEKEKSIANVIVPFLESLES